MVATHMGESKHEGGIQKYGWCPNIWGAFKHTELHPNICGHPNIQGMHSNIWGFQTYRGCPNTYRGCPNIKGGIQTYAWCPNIWGHQNIQGASKHCSRLKSVASSTTHMGATKHTGGHPNIQQGIQTYGWCANI